MQAHSTSSSNEPKENEIGLLGLFQVDLENMEMIEFAFMHHMQIPPTELRKWEYYYYESQVERLVDALKKKREAENSQNNQGQSFDASREAGKFLKQAKAPQMPNIKLPNFKK
jgi:hypothetical protein